MDDFKAGLRKVLSILDTLIVLAYIEVVVANNLIKNTKYSLLILHTEYKLFLLNVLEFQLLQG